MNRDKPKFIMEARLLFLRKWEQGILPTINLNNIPFYLPQSQLKQLQKEILKKKKHTQIYQDRTYFQQTFFHNTTAYNFFPVNSLIPPENCVYNVQLSV